jgi:hypothetical protein
MRTFIAIAAGGFAGAAIWLTVAHSATEISSVSKPTAPATVSFWDMHNQAHMEFLPVQQSEARR